MPFIALTTNEAFDEHVRKRLRKWFDESGQTQKEAGAVIGWEQQTVSSYFNGIQDIDFARAYRWTLHFGYQIKDLLEKSPTMKPQNPRLQRLIDKFHGASRAEQEWLLNAPVGRARSQNDNA
jgi:hypothetical protein